MACFLAYVVSDGSKSMEITHFVVKHKKREEWLRANFCAFVASA